MLPPYDEYTVAYADRSLVIDSEYLKESGYAIGANIIYQGRIVGIWKKIIKKDHLIIQTNLFSHLPLPDQNALQEAVHHYEKFIGVPVKSA